MTIPGLGLPFGMWQYDGSTMYPNNQLGVLNDISIYNNGCFTDRMENLAAQLQVTIPALLQRQQAQIAAQWQAQMDSISANNINALNNIFAPWQINNPNLNIPGLNNNNGRIPEGKILETLRKMGTGTFVADRINQEIVIKDKDGNERQITILNRLLELVDAYRKDPENAELSKEDYEKIWDIASRYDKNGDISSDDFATLKKIALKTESADDKKKPEGEEDENDENDDKSKEVTARSANYEAGKNSDMSVAAGIAFDAIDGMGTNKDKLRNAFNQVEKYNIIEFLDAFEMQDKNGQDLILRFWNDFDHYDNKGESLSPFGHDNAKPFMDPKTKISLVYKLNERATDVLALNNISKENKERLEKAVKGMKDVTDAMAKLPDESNLGRTQDTASWKGKHIAAFRELADAIKAAEEQCYGRES